MRLPRSIPTMRLPRRTLIIAAAVVLVDATSKVIVAHWLVPGQVVRVGPLLELDLYYNHAGASNALTGHPVLVSALSLLSTAVLVIMAAQVRSRGVAVALGLLIGGGVGNLVDRLAGGPGPFRGGVIDWIRPFGSRGSMNLADLAINLGVLTFVGLVLGGWARRLPRPSRAPCSAP
ncbi:MAG TPA: signal peptidase II [Solirubrobacteraceae bacterium]|nr:signal peptidase II [Solirubrobacteraceae bacterium]